MTFSPTPEQEAICAAALSTKSNLMVQAYAGCAKTTTLELLAKRLPPTPALALAFNVKIKKEMEKRLTKNFTVMTLNGLGHRAWGKAIGRSLSIEDRKVAKLIKEVAKGAGFNPTQEEWDSLRRLVIQVRNVGLVPSYFPHQGLVPDTPETWQELAEDLGLFQATPTLRDLARAILIESIKLGFQGVIDFDDQIYLSTMFNGVFPRFPLVLVDEAQDLSPLNHIQLKRCASDRLIVVGDPKQAIYAFRGADSASMAKIEALRQDWLHLPLRTTFRCPKAIVARQLDHAPGFAAWPTNPEGRFSQFRKVDAQESGWTWKHLEEENLLLPGRNSTLAILCRNNAPLLSLAFKLIRQGIGCQMLGRDIGKGLVSLSKKLFPDDATPVARCAELIYEWAQREISLARANEKLSKIDAIEDRAECLMAVLESSQVKDAGALRHALEGLFSRESGLVTLATGHRAKGLEWDLVVHLDPWRVPSKFARLALDCGDPRPMAQEMNLKYVIETRTKHTLILANLEDFS